MSAIIIGLLALYFVPTVTAVVGGRRNTLAIFALNLLLGWTAIGWIVALVWALAADGPRVIVTGSATPDWDRHLDAPPSSKTWYQQRQDILKGRDIVRT